MGGQACVHVWDRLWGWGGGARCELLVVHGRTHAARGKCYARHTPLRARVHVRTPLPRRVWPGFLARALTLRPARPTMNPRWGPQHAAVLERADDTQVDGSGGRRTEKRKAAPSAGRRVCGRLGKNVSLSAFLGKHRRKLLLLPEALCSETEHLDKHQRDVAKHVSWLESRLDEQGKPTFGCVACVRAGRKTDGARAFASFDVRRLHLSVVLKHQRSPFHIDNGRSYLGLGGHRIRFDEKSSPPASSFRKLWAELCKGSAVDKGIEGVGTAKTLARMRWCLAESLRSQDRKFLANAERTSLSRDERDGRLSIRFSATDGALVTTRRVLGQIKDYGSGAEATGKDQHTWRWGERRERLKIGYKLFLSSPSYALYT